MKLSSITTFTGFAALVAAAPKKSDQCSTATDRAVKGADVLIDRYHQDTGFWGDLNNNPSEFNGGAWWTTASMITTLMDLFELVPSKKEEYRKIVENTWYGAQKYQLTFNNNTEGLEELENKPTPLVDGSFWNDYYDDEGWWALAWVKAYDLLEDKKYLDAAKNIFEDMTTGFDVSSCGGVLWGKGKSYVSAISNELFLAVAASLATRAGDSDSDGHDNKYYLDWALKQWKWFDESHLWNSNNTINDGLLENCQNNNDVVWSYNQGVILGALVELNKAKKDQSYIDKAHQVAQGAIKQLSTDGILHDKCEPTCGDGSLNAQFKGIFVRNLAQLNGQSPKDEYKAFIENNAESIWTKDQGSDGVFGEVWSGPVAMPTDSSHSSALDCLVQVLSVDGC